MLHIAALLRRGDLELLARLDFSNPWKHLFDKVGSAVLDLGGQLPLGLFLLFTAEGFIIVPAQAAKPLRRVPPVALCGFIPLFRHERTGDGFPCRIGINRSPLLMLTKHPHDRIFRRLPHQPPAIVHFAQAIGGLLLWRRIAAPAIPHAILAPVAPTAALLEILRRTERPRKGVFQLSHQSSPFVAWASCPWSRAGCPCHASFPKSWHNTLANSLSLTMAAAYPGSTSRFRKTHPSFFSVL